MRDDSSNPIYSGNGIKSAIGRWTSLSAGTCAMPGPGKRSTPTSSARWVSSSRRLLSRKAEPPPMPWWQLWHSTSAQARRDIDTPAHAGGPCHFIGLVALPGLTGRAIRMARSSGPRVFRRRLSGDFSATHPLGAGSGSGQRSNRGPGFPWST